MPISDRSRAIANGANERLGQAPTPQNVGFVGGNDPGIFNAWDYPGLLTWMDMNDFVGKPGDNINGIIDRANPQRYYTPAGAIAPTFAYSNALPAAFFNSSLPTNGLQLAGGGLALGTFATPWTIVCVAQNTQATSDGNLHCLWGISGTFVDLLQINMTSTHQWETAFDPNVTGISTANVAEVDTQRRIWVAQATSSTTISVRSNGVSVLSATVTAMNAPTGATRVGSRNGVDRFWNGNIMEFMVFRDIAVMDSVTTSKLERALGRKWGILIP